MDRQPHPCSRCRFHGVKAPVHYCEVKECRCNGCKQIFQNGKLSMQNEWILCARCRIHGIETRIEHTCLFQECNCDGCQPIVIPVIGKKCPFCQNHGSDIPLRGHKAYCPYHHCHCEGCLLVKAQQEINRALDAFRRMQRIEARGRN